jgi:hypothetical protein
LYGENLRKGEIEMGEQYVTIPQEEYVRLLKAEGLFELVRTIALKDNSMYGYSTDTSKFIDILLGISRKEK